MAKRGKLLGSIILAALLLQAWVGAAAPQITSQRGVKPVPQAQAKTGVQGKSFALCMGINQYSAFPKLQTAVADARSVANELGQHFGFVKPEVLENPDRHAILTALNRYRKVLGPDDALLIYYAGHGHSDDKLQKAYWLPVDAQPDDTTNWISADDITTSVKIMDARQVLIVSDSCYSGRLARDAAVNLGTGATADRDRYLANIRMRKGRLLLSSGGNEPVSDGGGDGTHSVFATVLLQSLRDMSLGRFTVDELFSLNIRQRVGGRSKQVPELNALRDSGHDGGTFIFERVGARPLTGEQTQLPPEEMPRSGGGNSGSAAAQPSLSESKLRNDCDIDGIKSQLEQNAKNEGLLARLADCSYQAGLFAPSISAWTWAIDLNEGNAAYYDGRGQARLRNDSAEGARKDFEIATQKDAKNSQYWADLAQANEELDNPQEAAKCFDKAIRYGAKTKGNYLGLARAYDNTGNPDLAAEARNAAAKIPQ